MTIGVRARRAPPPAADLPGFAGRRPAALGGLLDGPLDGLFRGVHILPPFPSSGDRGFAPLTYEEIDPRVRVVGGHRSASPADTTSCST